MVRDEMPPKCLGCLRNVGKCNDPIMKYSKLVFFIAFLKREGGGMEACCGDQLSALITELCTFKFKK